jgi:hypothetical protein
MIEPIEGRQGFTRLGDLDSQDLSRCSVRERLRLYSRNRPVKSRGLGLDPAVLARAITGLGQDSACYNLPGTVRLVADQRKEILCWVGVNGKNDRARQASQ